MRFRRLRYLSALMSSAAAILGGANALAQPSTVGPQDAGARMVVEAKEMVYDEKKNIVTAQGQVQIVYKGRLLEADRVIYDRNTSRVYAEGHAQLTERDGTIARADRFDLTDDFKNGFIESLQVDAANDTHFSSPRAERSDDVTTFDLGSYTACEACKDDPSKPRTWQVKAKRIIHDSTEKTIYYEDATFELLGVPIAYVPFWSSADPTVRRKSGFLTPVLSYRQALGAGVGLPYFWAISPDSDLTITPTYFSRQGPYLTGELRKRFENGVMTFRGEGTHVGNPDAFAPAPYGAGDRRWRGALQTTGDFSLNDRWRAGWDITALSDRFFLQDYKQYNYLLQNYYFRESSSTIYLTGQGPRSYFDMRGYYFQVLSPSDVQAQQPVVHPVVDYNRVFDIDPAKTAGIGGQVELDANVTSTSASVAMYESINPRTLDSIYGLYNVCQLYQRSTIPANSQCLLRGVGGDYQHATLSGAWKRKVIDPVGGVWTAFAFARFVGSYLDYDRQGLYPIYNSFGEPIPNINQGLFFNGQ
ncbi:MAG: LPS-assembly protein LptD, partial [Hyphomicrobiales bacterium]